MYIYMNAYIWAAKVQLCLTLINRIPLITLNPYNPNNPNNPNNPPNNPNPKWFRFSVVY
jgi:hypothetical protein